MGDFYHFNHDREKERESMHICLYASFQDVKKKISVIDFSKWMNWKMMNISSPLYVPQEQRYSGLLLSFSQSNCQ